jgi:hypothetical protein
MAFNCLGLSLNLCKAVLISTLPEIFGFLSLFYLFVCSYNLSVLLGACLQRIVLMFTEHNFIIVKVHAHLKDLTYTAQSIFWILTRLQVLL